MLSLMKCQTMHNSMCSFPGFDSMDNKFLLNLLIFNMAALVLLLLIAAYVLLGLKRSVINLPVFDSPFLVFEIS